MIVFRIIATALMALSIFTGILKTLTLAYYQQDDDAKNLSLLTIVWSVLWRAFVIVALWVI